MYYNSPTLKIFCIVVTLSLTLALKLEFEKRMDQFNQDLFQKVENQNREKNVIMSPLSVQSIIGMLYTGAEGDTAAEVAQKFNITKYIRYIYYFKVVLAKFSQYGVTIANKLYIDENVHVKEKYRIRLRNIFYSSIEPVDFLCAEETADSINEWVSKQTNGLIPQLVHADTLSESTNLFLVNTITFSGTWKYKFNEANTEMSDFFVTAQKSVKVPMMFQSGRFLTQTHRNLKARSLILPYTNAGLSFVIFLPHNNADFNFLERKIKEFNLSELEGGYEANIDVFLPKFKAEFEFDLKDTLQNMGLGKLFGDSADLSGIFESSNTPLSISEFIHKAVINVDESGSIAAAASGVSLDDRNADTETFKANRPFIYFIKDNLNTVLFSGSYRGPEN